MDPLIGLVLDKDEITSYSNMASRMRLPVIPINHPYLDYLEIKKYVKEYENENAAKAEREISKHFKGFNRKIRPPSSTKKNRHSDNKNSWMFNMYKEAGDTIEFVHYLLIRKSKLYLPVKCSKKRLPQAKHQRNIRFLVRN